MSDKGSRDEQKNSLSDAEAAPDHARLCYVDDSRTSAYVIRRLLQPFGYQIDYFQSAEPAFVALIQEDFDLLLTDLKVSSKGMDGDDLIRTLRQSGHPRISSMPIIVITGATDELVLRDVYDAGANQVMKKPVDADELDGHIRRLLAEAKPVVNDDQGRSSDNVVSLTTAQRSAQKQSEDYQEKSSSRVSNKEKSEERDKKQKKVEIPVLNTVSQDSQHEVQRESLDIKKKTNNVSEKESLLERAINFQNVSGTIKQDKDDNIEQKIDVSVSAENAFLQDEKLDSVKVSKSTDDIMYERKELSEEDIPDFYVANEEELQEENVIIEPESHNNNRRDSATNKPEIDGDILEDMHKHALVFRERTGFIQGSKLSGIIASLIELIGMRSLFQRALLAGLAIVLIMMGWSLFYDQGMPVETAFVESGEIFQSITVPGRVVSKQRVNISSAHTGRLVKVLVKEGDVVESGQLLAQLDDRELISRLNRVKANLTDTREGIVLAKRTLDRLSKAFKKGAVARRFVEDAEVDLRTARSKAGIAVEEVHSATLELDKQRIIAPFAGKITARYAEVGQWTGPTESLFILVDESQREIEVRIDAADSTAIDVGQVVGVSSDAFPGLEWHESVIRLGAAANNDNNSNSVKVYISLGSDAPSLRFGQQVDADIRTAWNPSTLKVPFEALINRDGQTLVAILHEGRVKLRPVETGIEDFSMVEIKQGLNNGDMVILAKGQFFQNGDKAYPIRDTN